MSGQFAFERLVVLPRRTHEETRDSADGAIDSSLAVRARPFGWYIGAFAVGVSACPELYGEELINWLSERLRANRINGCSPTNPRKCREFYQIFAEIRQTLSVNSGEAAEIQQTPSAKSLEASVIGAPPSLTKLGAWFQLDWFHHITQLTLNSADARCSYEIEAAGDGWSNSEYASEYQRYMPSKRERFDQLRSILHEIGGRDIGIDE